MSIPRKQKFFLVVQAISLALLIVGLTWTDARWLHASETTVTQQNLLVNQSAAQATHTPVGPAFMPRGRETAIYVSWSAGVTSGVVTIETADNSAYTGTWAPLATVTFAGTAPNEQIVQITGVHLAVRCRISTVVAGGTVSSMIVVN